MKLKFLCSYLSGTGGTETVLIKVLNQLVLDDANEIELVLTGKPEEEAWLKRLDPKVKISLYDGKVKRITKVAQAFITADEKTTFVSLSPKMVKLGAKIKRFFHKKYKLLSWIHFSLDDQDMFDAKNTVTLADGHLAISSPIKEQLLSYGVSEDKVKLIFNPIEPIETKLPDDPKAEHNYFYAGRLMLKGQKNLSEMLDAIGMLEDAKLDIYGTGSEAKACEDYAKDIGIADRVIWHGWTPNLWEAIKTRPAALVMTSEFEGLPMIMLEALAHGIPVVSSRFEGYQDVIQDGKNGFTYDVGNMDALKKALLNVKEANFSSDTIKQSIERFYTKTYYQNLNQALRELIEG